MLLVRLAHRAREEGFFQTARWLRERVDERFREYALGINTRGFLHWHQLGDDPACKSYLAVPYGSLNVAFKTLQLTPGKDVFLDFGSGKGRALVQAARLPFRKVIGVERSPDLCRAARQNVEKARKRLRCQDVQIIEMDARAYQVPADVSVVFLFNPFVGEVLAAVLDNIYRSLREAPRNLTLFYICLQGGDDPFAEHSWLTRRQELRNPSVEKLSSLVYEYRPDRSLSRT